MSEVPVYATGYKSRLNSKEWLTFPYTYRRGDRALRRVRGLCKVFAVQGYLAHKKQQPPPRTTIEHKA